MVFFWQSKSIIVSMPSVLSGNQEMELSTEFQINNPQSKISNVNAQQDSFNREYELDDSSALRRISLTKYQCPDLYTLPPPRFLSAPGVDESRMWHSGPFLRVITL